MPQVNDSRRMAECTRLLGAPLRAELKMTEPEAPAYVLVVLPGQNIRPPEMLRHIEAGRMVLLIPAPNAPC